MGEGRTRRGVGRASLHVRPANLRIRRKVVERSPRSVDVGPVRKGLSRTWLINAAALFALTAVIGVASWRFYEAGKPGAPTPTAYGDESERGLIIVSAPQGVKISVELAFSGESLNDAELKIWSENGEFDDPIPVQVNLYNRALVTQGDALSTGFDFFETEHDPDSGVDRQVGVVNLVRSSGVVTSSGCRSDTFWGERLARSMCLNFREKLLVRDRARVTGALPVVFWPTTCPRPKEKVGAAQRDQVMGFNPLSAFLDDSCVDAQPVAGLPGIRVRIDTRREPVRVDFASPPPADSGTLTWNATTGFSEAVDVSYALITDEARRQDYQFLSGVLIGLAAAVLSFLVQALGRIRK